MNSLMKTTFEKIKHIRRNSEFLKVYGSGKRINDPSLSMVVLFKPQQTFTRLGLSVSRKVGKAVLRNKLKRRIREIFRLNQQSLKPGFDVVVVGRTAGAKLAYLDLQACFLNLSRRAGVFSNPE